MPYSQVAAVAAPGRAQTAEQLGPYAGHVAQQAGGLEVVREHQRGAHWSDGVRRGGTDADPEQLEHADGHATLLG